MRKFDNVSAKLNFHKNSAVQVRKSCKIFGFTHCKARSIYVGSKNVPSSANCCTFQKYAWCDPPYHISVRNSSLGSK